MESKELESAIKIIKTLQDNNHIAVLAGGCVRDKIMDIFPKDYDIATSASPEQVESLFAHTIPVGKSFGVIAVLVDKIEFEVATLRIDSKISNGRHPSSIEYTNSLLEDARRRDFTMNALFYDPVVDKTYDFFGGELDIQDKIIACVGGPDRRFEEDKLRMLRAIRFSSSLNFKIEEYTWDSICKNAYLIKEVSMERIKMELDKILQSNYPVKGLELLKKCGILDIILPEVSYLDKVEQSHKWHSEGSCWIHTMLALENIRNNTQDIDILWGILLHDIGKEKCAKTINGSIKHTGHAKVGAEMSLDIMNRFKFSNDHKEAVYSIVENHMKIKHADKMKKSTLRRLMSNENFEKIKSVSYYDSMSAIPLNKEDGENKYNWFNYINKTEKELKNQIKLPDPLITGKDLITLGLTPSKLFGTILKNSLDRQLNGEINTKEEAIERIIIDLNGRTI
jgi:tRNA nucleotidyltransferase/poly(A) polymerase